MNRSLAPLAAWALIAGTVVAGVGYLAGFLADGSGADRFAGPSWSTLYTIALFGDVLILLGLPTVLYAQRDRAPRLTLIGYVGLFVPLAVLNVGEGAIEGFAKPYLAHHGGIPAEDLPGLVGFETPAVLIMLGGLICLGIAVLRARELPWWVGALFIASPVLGAIGLPGLAGLISDYLCFVALFVVAVHVLRTTDRYDSEPPTRGPGLVADSVRAEME